MSAQVPAARAPGEHLLGRRREREVLDRFLEAAREGRGGVLVLHGEPGVGKTALLEYAVDASPAFRVARTIGVEGEMELPFAALEHLCSPFLDLVQHLPQPQRDALGVAFGLSAGPSPNPFLIGLAVLGLLSEAAEEQPLLGVVDDAQWLDRASARALAFVARRLLAERIALVFATRTLRDTTAGLPELGVTPLGHRDARALLESVLPAPLDDGVLERIVVETRGNPLALIELPRGLTPAQLAGGFGLPAAVPLSASIEESFTRRLARLPHDARRLLLVAAADPVGDPALIWRAAERLGISETAAETVQAEDLLTFTPRVVFRHPLVRSAVYGAAGVKERREIHRALAEATDPEADPDRRVWHRALAEPGPDEDVAAELERSAARAQARGGFAAAAAFLQRAAAMTPDADERARRALAAARAKLQAGAVDDTLELLATAETGTLSDAPARSGRPAPRRDRLRRHPRPRRAAAARRSRPATRRARSGPRARDVSGGAVCGDVRGAPRRTGRRSAGGGASGQSRPRPTPPAARARPAARRPDDAVQRQLRGRGAGPATSARGIRCRPHVRRRAAALEMAGDPGLRAPLGRHAMGADRGGARRARPQDRRPRRAPARAHPARLRPRLRGRARSRGVAGGGDPDDDGGIGHARGALRRRRTPASFRATRPTPHISSSRPARS